MENHSHEVKSSPQTRYIYIAIGLIVGILIGLGCYFLAQNYFKAQPQDVSTSSSENIGINSFLSGDIPNNRALLSNKVSIRKSDDGGIVANGQAADIVETNAAGDVPVYKDVIYSVRFGVVRDQTLSNGKVMEDFQITNCQMGWKNSTNSSLRPLNIDYTYGFYVNSSNQVIRSIQADENYNPSTNYFSPLGWGSYKPIQTNFLNPLDFSQEAQAKYIDVKISWSLNNSLNVGDRFSVLVFSCQIKEKSTGTNYNYYGLTTANFIVTQDGSSSSSSTSSSSSSTPTPGNLETLDVFRFYRPARGIHFYTGSVSERDKVINTLPSFQYEGKNFSAFKKPASPVADVVPVYRFYNASLGTHVFTASESEKDKIINTLPQFEFEGAKFYAYKKDVSGSQPVYRFYNVATGVHFFTKSEREKDKVIATLPQFLFEGAKFYVPAQ